jgi:hypothetical protein
VAKVILSCFIFISFFVPIFISIEAFRPSQCKTPYRAHNEKFRQISVGEEQ